MTVTNPSIVWGINGEGRNNWWRSGLRAAVYLSDTYSFNIYFYSNDRNKYYLTDQDDKKGTSYTRKYAYRHYRKALSRIGLRDGVLADTIKSLHAALASKTSAFKLDKILKLLKEKGLTLDQIAKLQGLSGDALIKKLLDILGVNSAEYTKDFDKAKGELEDAIRNYAKAPDKAAAARNIQTKLDALKKTLNGSTPVLSAAIIKLAGQTLQLEAQRLDGLKKTEAARQAAAAKKKAFIAYINLNNQTISNYLSVVNSVKGKGPFDVNGTLYTVDEIKGYLRDPEVKRAIGNRALALILANPKAGKPNDVKALEEYIYPRLKRDQRVVAFTYKKNTYVAVTENRNGKWVFVSRGVPKKYIPRSETIILVKRPWYLRDRRVTAQKLVDGSNPPTQLVMVKGIPLKIHLATEGNKVYIEMRNGERREVTGRLKEIIDNYTKTHGKGDGVITMAELRRFIRVLRKYAKVHGIDVYQAAKLYLSATEFEDRDLDNALKAKGYIINSIKGAMAKKKLDKLSLKELSAVLGDLGYKTDVISEVVRLANQMNKASLNFVASCLMRVVESARIQHDLLGVKYDNINREYTGIYTPQRIVAWLKGEEKPVNIGNNTETVVVDRAALKKRIMVRVFHSDIIERGAGAIKGSAKDFIQALTNAGQIAHAKVAIELIKKEAVKRGGKKDGSKFNLLLQKEFNVETSALIAEGARKAKMYQTAFEYAKKAGGQRHDLITNIFLACRNTRKLYKLVLEILKYGDWDMQRGLARNDELSQLAQKFLETKDSMAERRLALEALNFIRDKQNPNCHTTYKVRVPGPRGGQQEIQIDGYITRIENELRLPLRFFQIQLSVFPPRAKPVLGDNALGKKGAIAKLKDIIIDKKTSSLDRAYALKLIAEIYVAIANAYSDEDKITPSTIGESRTIKYYTLGAKAARQSALAFTKLSEQTPDSKPNLKRYYTDTVLEINGIIATEIAQWAKMWQNSKYHNRGRVRRWPAYLRAFQPIAKYILAGKKLVFYDENNNKTTRWTMWFKDIYVNLTNDEEHPRTRKYMLNLNVSSSPNTGVNKPSRNTRVRKARRGRRYDKTEIRKSIQHANSLAKKYIKNPDPAIAATASAAQSLAITAKTQLDAGNLRQARNQAAQALILARKAQKLAAKAAGKPQKPASRKPAGSRTDNAAQAWSE